MPCSQQPTSAYQHSHPFIGPYSKTFQSSPLLHTLLNSTTRFNIILNNYAIYDKQYLFVRFLDQNFACISRLPCVLRTPTTILLDFVTIIKITWSCPLRNFLNPQHFHFSDDFPKLSQYALLCFAVPKSKEYYTQREALYAHVPQTAHAVSNSVIQTALCQ
jgi:hypothetical protein